MALSRQFSKEKHSLGKIDPFLRSCFSVLSIVTIFPVFTHRVGFVIPVLLLEIQRSFKYVTYRKLRQSLGCRYVELSGNK